MSTDPLGSFESESDEQACKRYVGCYFEQMRQSYQTTREYLKHADPRARFGAIAMLRAYWKPTTDLPQLCEKMASEDDDLNVRCIALNSLIPFIYESRDSRVGRWLARLVRDETQPALVRKLAYCMLFALQGILDQPIPSTLLFPEQVDWTFVDRFLQERNGEYGQPQPGLESRSSG